MATLALFLVGVADQTGPIRVVGAVIAAVTGTLSLVFAKKRGNLVGWYAITAGVMVLRLMSGS
ncbi:MULTISPECIES: hypothetical protein [unclassified Curtobacterium]|uniref:hypothetical protein n=1 Tax=unclassified Curtobacterium TaxID=257496 RepID=UPI003805A55F